MKLIIDIPDDLYKTKKALPGYMCGVMEKAVQNGTPLEQIRAEIANLTCDCINGMVNQYAVLQIIDKYAEQEPMDHDSVSRGYLLGLANKDGAYGYISAHEIVNAPSLNRQEPSEDAVSRQAVLDIIDKWYESNRGVENIEDLIILITYMASVRPQERTGKWADSMEGESNG